MQHSNTIMDDLQDQLCMVCAFIETKQPEFAEAAEFKKRKYHKAWQEIRELEAIYEA